MFVGVACIGVHVWVGYGKSVPCLSDRSTQFDYKKIEFYLVLYMYISVCAVPPLLDLPYSGLFCGILLSRFKKFYTQNQKNCMVDTFLD